MKRLLIAVLLAVSAFAQTRDTYPRTPVVLTVATLPASPATNTRATISDGASATDCTTGGGSTVVDCRYTGSAWTEVPGSVGGSSTTYWDQFPTGARGASSANLPAGGWSVGHTGGGGLALTNGDANYIIVSMTLADAADTHLIWRGTVPPNYTNQTVTAKFYWMSTGGGTNSIMAEVATAFTAAGGSYVPSFNTAQTSTSASGGNNVVNVITITGLTMTGASAGEEWFIRFMRDGDGGSDNLAATINLIRMELSY